MQTVEAAEVKWGAWIGEGWQMFTSQWLAWVAIMLVFLLLIIVPIAPIYAFMIAAQLASAGDPEAQTETPALLFMLLPVLYLAIILGSSYLMTGAYRAAFKQMRGGKISVSDLFSGGDAFLRAAGGVVLVGLLASVGALFCILPAFAVVGLLYFTLPLIVERKLGVFDAMRTSFEKTKGRWFMFALFAIVVSLLAQLGSVACGIGVLATFPLYFTINAVAYRDLFGMPGAQHFLEQQVPPSAGYAQPWSSPGEAPKPALQCPRCGATGLAPGARFCNLCGANLTG